MAGPLTPGTRRLARRLALAALGLGVALGHGLVGCTMADLMAGWGVKASLPPRLEAVFVTELQPTEPPPVVAAATPAPPVPATPVDAAAPVAEPASAPASTPARRKPKPAARKPDVVVAAAAVASEPTAAASAPDGVASAPLEADPPASEPSRPADLVASAPAEPPPSAASAAAAEPPADAASSATALAASPAASAGSAAAAATAFEWPPSTRLRYRLEGWYRGSVEGRAQVEWLQQGDRYQVHLDVSAALLFTRRMTSSGRITAEGLSPERYDEITERPFAAPRQVTMRFDADTVTLGNGQQQPRPPSVQDTASQFVQLTWLFATHREPLRAGARLTMPLALPRSVHTWYFDILGEEPLYTPFGTIQTFHVRPQRATPSRSELTPEIWFAPSLQYLPVRIRIRQDEENYVDLMVDQLPQQAQR